MVLVKEEARLMKISLLLSNIGKSFVPNAMHSVANSYDRLETSSRNLTNLSNSENVRLCKSGGLDSKNLHDNVLDFQVPLYRLLPKFAHRSI